MFRFENLEIWQDAIDLSDEIENKKRFRFAGQLRGAALSISNNIAEGSGSFSDKDFAHFLNIARRSVFECANILIILQRRKFISEEIKFDLLKRLDILSRKVTNFRKKLVG